MRAPGYAKHWIFHLHVVTCEGFWGAPSFALDFAEESILSWKYAVCKNSFKFQVKEKNKSFLSRWSY